MVDLVGMVDIVDNLGIVDNMNHCGQNSLGEYADDFWLLEFASRHFSMDKVDMVGIGDKVDRVDNIDMVDNVSMVDRIDIVNLQNTFGYLMLRVDSG